MKWFSCFLLAIAGVSFVSLAADTANFKTDSEGFILNWLVLEPIRLNAVQHNEAGVRQIIATEYFKEQLSILPKDGDQVTAGDATYQWHALKAKDYLMDLTGFASAHGKPVVNVLFWGVAYITAPEEMKDARLAIGSDDDSVWWVNGKEVIAAYGVRQTSSDDNVSKRLTLNKGVNVVRFAVVQGDGPSDCCARFYDARQKLITSLTISLDPAVVAKDKPK